MISRTSQKYSFNEQRYRNYEALSSTDNFFTDRVYLYKIYRLIKSLDIVSEEKIKILEIGCADGTFAKVLKNDGYDVYGIDISKGAIDKALKLGVKAIQADIEQGIDFPDNFFDIVIAAEIIEHLYDTDRFLEQVNRTTKGDGYLFITTPNLASLKNRIRLLFGKYPQYSEFRLNQSAAGHIRNYTVDTLVQQMEENNWQIIKIASPNIICPMTRSIPFFVKKFAMFLGNIFYSIGSHIIIMAKK